MKKRTWLGLLLASAGVAAVLTRVLPGDPVLMVLGPAHSSPENIAQLRKVMGLDHSVPERASAHEQDAPPAPAQQEPDDVVGPKDEGERSRGDLVEFAAHCSDGDCRRGRV